MLCFKGGGATKNLKRNQDKDAARSDIHQRKHGCTQHFVGENLALYLFFHFHIISKSVASSCPPLHTHTLEMEPHCFCVSMKKRKLELHRTLFCRNTIRLLPLRFPKLSFCPLSSNIHSSAEEPVVAGGFYLIIESEDVTRKIGLTVSAACQNNIQQRLPRPPHSIFCVLATLLSLFHILCFTFTS